MEGQPDAEGGAAVDVALQFDPAAVVAHDPLHNHQAETGPFLLGRVEGLENTIDLVLGNPGAAVRNTHPNPVLALVGLQCQDAPLVMA